MAARTRFLQLAIGAVNLAIVALVFTSIYPFPSGDFKVDLPSPNDIQWSYSNGVVHVTAPYSIDNGGIYDIDDLTIGYRVTNLTSYVIAYDTILIGRIPAGRVTSDAIDFAFDLLALYNSGAQYMIFNDDLLNFYVEVSCFYTMRLIKFDANYRISVPWDALIQDWGVSGVSPWPPSGPTFTVDYWLVTSDMLSTLPPADITLTLRDASGPVRVIRQTVQLGGNYTGSVTFTGLTSYNPPYSVEIQVMDFTVQERWTL
ncbi:MAG: hypothetical protein ACUVT7_01585 [Thermoplasmata archaeon]